MSAVPARTLGMSAAILKLPPLLTVRLPGGTVCYREAQGPAGAPVVVLLHGFLATSGLNWMHAFEPLGRHFRVIAPDLCGHGGDAFERRRFTLQQSADDVAMLIVGLRLERVIVVGYSMGGMVAQYLARDHAGLLGGMVLSGVDWGSRQHGRVMTLLYPVVVEAALRAVHLHACLLRAPLALARGLLATNTTPGPLSAAAAEFGGHDPRAMGGAAREISLFRSIEWLHRVRLPTTVLVTLRDNLFPAAEQRRMARAIPGARVREYDGGHVSCRLPEYATALVRACRDVASRMRGRRR